jgi:hypothetical protein
MAKITPSNLRVSPGTIKIKEVGNTGVGTSDNCVFTADLSAAASADFPIGVTATFDIITSDLYEFEDGSDKKTRNVTLNSTTGKGDFKFKLRNKSKFNGKPLPITLSITTFDNKIGAGKVTRRKTFPVEIE